MPKNLRGGKHKHIKRGTRYIKDETLILASDQPGCMYAIIQKKLGRAFEVLCSNGKVERALNRGKFRNKVWMNPGDIVLVDGTELNKLYIVHKYTPDQAKQLKSKGEISFDIKKNDQNEIIFDDENNSSSDEDNDLFKELDATENVKIIENEDNIQPNKNKPDGLSESSEDDSSESLSDKDNPKEKRFNDNLVNEDKLKKKFKNKAHGGKGIIRERIRSAARDKKNKNKFSDN